jgi:hypothetical protein
VALLKYNLHFNPHLNSNFEIVKEEKACLHAKRLLDDFFLSLNVKQVYLPCSTCKFRGYEDSRKVFMLVSNYLNGKSPPKNATPNAKSGQLPTKNITSLG